MTALILYAVHSALALVLTVASFGPPRLRRALTLGAAGVGAAAGVAVAVLGSSELVWRTTTLASPRAAVAGSAVACAWILAAAHDRARTPRVGALVGLASSAVLVASLNDWVVPALLFWLGSSAALIALAAHGGLRTGAILAIVVSDLLVAGSFTVQALGDGIWTFPSTLSAVPLGLALLGFVVRSAALPRIGVWETLDSPAVPALPLLLGGSLAIVGPPLASAGPQVAVTALIAALACCGATLAPSKVRLSVLGAWPAWLSLGLIAVAPRSFELAALSGLLALTSVTLLAPAAPRAQTAGGLVIGFLPLTVGFVAIATTALAAFDKASETGSTADSLAWSAVAALLPAVVASGLALGARLGSAGGSRSPASAPSLALWALLIAGVTAGLFGVGAGSGLLGPPGEVLALQAGALVAGSAAAVVASRRTNEKPRHRQGRRLEAESGVLVYSEDGGDAAVVASLAALISLGAIVTVGYLTVEGLSSGFLPPSTF